MENSLVLGKPVYKIFVGSIPGQIDVSVLEEYFKTFGPIERVRMFFRGQGAILNKGYCHLIINERDTYEKILQKPIHTLGMRRIFCSAYISGRKLVKHNMVSNAKRIVVKDIPCCLTDQDMYSIFGQFGNVTMAYIFTSPTEELNEPRAPIGSVQFVDALSAKALAQRKFVKVKKGTQTFTLTVNRYLHNYGEPFGLLDSVDKEESYHHFEDIRTCSKKNNFENYQKKAKNSKRFEQILSYNLHSAEQTIGSQLNDKTIGKKKIIEVKIRCLPSYHLFKPSRKAYYTAVNGYRIEVDGEENLRFNQLTIINSKSNNYFKSVNCDEEGMFTSQDMVVNSPLDTRADSRPLTAREECVTFPRTNYMNISNFRSKVVPKKFRFKF